MELREIFHILKKRAMLIVLITFTVTLASGIISYLIIKPAFKPVYKADISVIIVNTEKEKVISTINPNYSDVLTQNTVKTCIELAKSRIVAEDVIKKLNLKSMKASELSKMITVVPGATEILTINVESKDDPEKATKIANQVAKSLKEISANIRKSDNVMILDTVLLSKSEDTSKPMNNTVKAFFLGLIIALGVVFIKEGLDKTKKNNEVK